VPRIPLITLALLAPLAALGQSPQSLPRDVPAPPVYYTPAPQAPPPPVYYPPRPPVYYQAEAPAQPRTLVEVPLVPGRAPRAPRGPLVLEMRLPRLCLHREPALSPVAVQAVQQAVYQPVEARGLEAPPKAPSPRALPAPQSRGLEAPEKGLGGIDPAEEPAWAVRLGKRLDSLERRLDGIEGVDPAGDRAAPPPPAVAK
jgi:hypothetical protein